METAFLAITIAAALATGCAAALNLAGAASVALVADRVRVPRSWMVPLGLVLAAGALGLLAGLALPALGAAAALGLVLYFLCALGAHARARDRGFGGALFFLLLAAGALLANLAAHGLG